jgi:hypothetical protein
MAAPLLRDSCGAYRRRNRSLDRGLAQVVAPLDATSRVRRAAFCRKHVLPPPVARRVRILACQCIGEPHRAEALGQILGVEDTLRRELAA